jgi:hypothetical protein
VQPERIAVRFGTPGVAQLQRLLCTCAPVYDYTGRQVARVGAFAHAADEQPFSREQTAGVMELARLISLRLGHFLSLPASGYPLPASGFQPRETGGVKRDQGYRKPQTGN